MTNQVKEGFETHANKDFYTSGENGKSATRTVYMDSNIALTDGSAPVGSGTAKTIPNLYNAINSINSRITDHDHDNTYLKQSEAVFTDTEGAVKDAENIGDAVNKLNAAVGTLTGMVGAIDNIIVTGYSVENKNVVGAIDQLNTNIDAIKDKEISSVEAYMYATADNTTHVLSPGNGTIGSKHAAGSAAETKNLRLKAKDIEFEIPAPTITGYKVTAAGAAVDVNTEDSVTINAGDYWIPIETAINETVSIIVESGRCGRVIRNGDIIANHCRLSADLRIDSTETQLFTPDGKLSANATIIYNLGAIIEAIQELNRRTMFMDTNMSFSGSIHYGDVAAGMDDARYETVADGLPGASNINFHKHVDGI